MADGNSVVNALQAGLQAASTRSKVIAGNIANLETPNYRRKDVRFEELFQKAVARDGVDLVEVAKPEVFEPRTGKVDRNGNDVVLDVEVGEMVKNSAKYKAYMRLLTRTYRQMHMAIDGK